MTAFEVYESGKGLICRVMASSHLMAASQAFKAFPALQAVSVGEQGNGPEWSFKRGGGPVRVGSC